MSFDAGLVDLAAEGIAPLGSHTMRRMMGSAMLYCDGLPYALVAGDALWFKSDAETASTWGAAGAERFTFARKDGSIAVIDYRRAPEDVYDDPDAFRYWAALALDAARRAAVAKDRRAKK